MSDEQIPENPEESPFGVADASQTPAEPAVAPEEVPAPTPFDDAFAAEPVAAPPEDAFAAEPVAPPPEEPFAAEPVAPPPEEGKPKRRKIDLKSRLSSVRGTGALAAGAASSDRKS
jgi:hypothetical protein